MEEHAKSILDVIVSRRNARKWKSDAVSDANIKDALEAANECPFSGQRASMMNPDIPKPRRSDLHAIVAPGSLFLVADLPPDSCTTSQIAVARAASMPVTLTL